jgi:hypothetical protein
MGNENQSDENQVPKDRKTRPQKSIKEPPTQMIGRTIEIMVTRLIHVGSTPPRHAHVVLLLSSSAMISTASI